MANAAPELEVRVADRNLPLSVVGRLYRAAREEGLNTERYRESVALWNAIQRADKRAKGMRPSGGPLGPTITPERLTELLIADGYIQAPGVAA